jgi:hypothetical protein
LKQLKFLKIGFRNFSSPHKKLVNSWLESLLTAIGGKLKVFELTIVREQNSEISFKYLKAQIIEKCPLLVALGFQNYVAIDLQPEGQEPIQTDFSGLSKLKYLRYVRFGNNEVSNDRDLKNLLAECPKLRQLVVYPKFSLTSLSVGIINDYAEQHYNRKISLNCFKSFTSAPNANGIAHNVRVDQETDFNEIVRQLGLKDKSFI